MNKTPFFTGFRPKFYLKEGKKMDDTTNKAELLETIQKKFVLGGSGKLSFNQVIWLIEQTEKADRLQQENERLSKQVKKMVDLCKTYKEKYS